MSACRAGAPDVDAPANPPPVSRPAAPPVAPATEPHPDAPTHLQIAGTIFKTAAGQPFQWRGITAFRLLDFVADGDEAAATRYLAWAASQKLTVVRVLAMGGGFMDLRPQPGRDALSRLLDLAAAHGLYVEVVALAGTRDMPVDLDQQLTALGAILGRHANAILEVANEPAHPSQAPDVGKPEVLLALAARVPSDIPVSLGSLEENEGFARGDYATWHVPRDSRLDGWGHVLAVAQGGDLVRRLGKPVVSDEPIGAGAVYEPGRRDDQPSRFRAAALLTRLAGMGATFHYGAGLQATIPEGRELECFNAWNEAWHLLPEGVEQDGAFAIAGTADVAGTIVQGFNRQSAFGVFERRTAGTGWILAVGPGDPALVLAPGWKVRETKTFEGARLVSVARQ